MNFVSSSSKFFHRWLFSTNHKDIGNKFKIFSNKIRLFLLNLSLDPTRMVLILLVFRFIASMQYSHCTKTQISVCGVTFLIGCRYYYYLQDQANKHEIHMWHLRNGTDPATLNPVQVPMPAPPIQGPLPFPKNKLTPTPTIVEDGLLVHAAKKAVKNIVEWE